MQRNNKIIILAVEPEIEKERSKESIRILLKNVFIFSKFKCSLYTILYISFRCVVK